jgi:hypothetical protein
MKKLFGSSVGEKHISADGLSEVLAELVAIWLWDEDYRRSTVHDEIDLRARDARRRREAEIVQMLCPSLPAGLVSS